MTSFESVTDRMAAIQRRGMMFPTPPNMPDCRPIVSQMTTEQTGIFGFEASAPHAERFYGFAARHFINMARYDQFMHDGEPIDARAPEAAHFERLQGVSSTLIASMMSYFRDNHGVDVDTVFEQARQDTIAAVR